MTPSMSLSPSHLASNGLEPNSELLDKNFAFLKILVEENRLDAVYKQIKASQDLIFMMDEKGQTPLHWAAIKGHVAICEMIRDLHPISARGKDGDGNTPLHSAARWGHEAVCTSLLSQAPWLACELNLQRQNASQDAFINHHVDLSQKIAPSPELAAMREAHELDQNLGVVLALNLLNDKLQHELRQAQEVNRQAAQQVALQQQMIDDLQRKIAKAQTLPAVSGAQMTQAATDSYALVTQLQEELKDQRARRKEELANTNERINHLQLQLKQAHEQKPGGPRIYTSEAINIAISKTAISSLGEGDFGKVQEYELEGRIVAIKIRKSKSDQGWKEFYAEVYALSTFVHACILPIIGFAMDIQNPSLVLPVMRNGTLQKRLDEAGAKPPDTVRLFSLEERMKVIWAIASALAYVHSHGYVHLDVKPEHVLLDPELFVRLADFGVSRKRQPNIPDECAVGTEGFICPKYATHRRPDDTADIFSFGVVSLLLATGAPLFGGEDSRSLPERLDMQLDNTLENNQEDEDLLKYCKKIPTSIPFIAENEEQMKTLCLLAARCLNYNEKKRPKMHEFQSNWTKLN